MLCLWFKTKTAVTFIHYSLWFFIFQYVYKDIIVSFCSKFGTCCIWIKKPVNSAVIISEWAGPICSMIIVTFCLSAWRISIMELMLEIACEKGNYWSPLLPPGELIKKISGDPVWLNQSSSHLIF